jgi:hypothetical protein
MDIVEFLLARFIEDEAAAVRDSDVAILPGHWARWVRDECEAKRRIMRIHRTLSDAQPNLPLTYPVAGFQCVTCGHGDEWQAQEYPIDYPCATLLALALPYADHPDYRAEWALGEVRA